MRLNVFNKFREKSKAFKITAVIAAVVIVVLGIILYILSPNIPAESISFSDETVYLQADMTYTLKPELRPYNTTEGNLVYRCSDADIAALSGNTVRALREGTAEIYCYDRKSRVKSNVIKFKVVKSIESLIAKEPSENEEEYVEGGGDAAIYVYYTKNGSRYHTAECSLLGKNPKKGILSNVKSSGRTPCTRCMP